MVKLDLQYDLVNGTPATASPPQANFSRTEQYVNQELINRDGSVAMSAQLRLSGDPLVALDAAPKQYVDAAMPIGSMVMFGGVAAPAGGKWLLCDGADLESSTYPDLFAAIGTSYGGTGGHFNLPNLTQRFPMGAAPTRAVGSTGGGTDAIVPPHTHPIDHTHAGGTTGNTDLTHSHGDDHQHTGTTAGANRRHLHQLPDVTVIQVTAAPTFYTHVTGGGGFDIASTQFNLNSLNTGVDSPTHEHDFTTNFKSQQGYGATTGNGLGVHGHTFQTPAHGGSSGAASGAAASAVDGRLPPYVIVNYLIRAR
jgi:hypothetical protein